VISPLSSLLDLTPYKLPLAPVPPDVEEALGRGIQHGAVWAPGEAAELLASGRGLSHAATRADDGRLWVTTTTELPGVTPDMIDWWFGWHLPESERYRLWHPTAHVRAVVKEDRSALAGSREAYVGNSSYVDEYIGPVLMKLAITFVRPTELGFTEDTSGAQTVICGRTADRAKHADAGQLVHRVVRTAGGARMQSLFWLGEIMPKVPLVGPLVARVLNRAAVRRMLLPDSLGLALLRHCSEEMNHLAKFLPRLYEAART
jgi:hypothetical protein